MFQVSPWFSQNLSMKSQQIIDWQDMQNLCHVERQLVSPAEHSLGGMLPNGRDVWSLHTQETFWSILVPSWFSFMAIWGVNPLNPWFLFSSDHTGITLYPVGIPPNLIRVPWPMIFLYPHFWRSNTHVFEQSLWIDVCRLPDSVPGDASALSRSIWGWKRQKPAKSSWNHV